MKASVFVIGIRGDNLFLASIQEMRFTPSPADAIRISNLAGAVKVARELNRLPKELRKGACFFARAV
jgi:hypothetical protein